MAIRLTAAIFLSLLASCLTPVRLPVQQTTSSPPSPTRLSVAVIAGQAEADDGFVEAEGSFIGGRAEASYAFGEGQFVELGLRSGFGFGDLDIDVPVGEWEVEASQFVLGPVLRVHFTDHAQTVRPFVEAAVGFNRTTVDSFLNIPGTQLSGSDTDGGLWYALGGGVSFRASDSVEIFVQGQLEHSELDDLETDVDVFALLFGGRFRL